MRTYNMPKRRIYSKLLATLHHWTPAGTGFPHEHWLFCLSSVVEQAADRMYMAEAADSLRKETVTASVGGGMAVMEQLQETSDETDGEAEEEEDEETLKSELKKLIETEEEHRNIYKHFQRHQPSWYSILL